MIIRLMDCMRKMHIIFFNYDLVSKRSMRNHWLLPSLRFSLCFQKSKISATTDIVNMELFGEMFTKKPY